LKTELRLDEAWNLGELQPLVRAYHAFENIPSREAERESALRRLVSDRTLGGTWRSFATITARANFTPAPDSKPAANTC